MATFPYTIKSNSRSKSVRIAVHHDGMVIVTKPKFIPKLAVKLIVEKRSSWVLEQMEKLAQKPKRLLAQYSIKDYKENKQKAYEIIWNKVLHYNKFYKYNIGKIYIRNQKTRWGSCSGKRNLNFNYKIVFLPEVLQDYIVVHEICHLKEMNHSARFWSLVAVQIPNYKQQILEIKKY